MNAPLTAQTVPPYAENMAKAFATGLSFFGAPPPMSLSQWAERHFYLSAESSNGQGAWRPWPFQIGIMNLMSNDDVVELDVTKSKRVGYTKMLLAHIGYTAHHLRRNQCIWRPTDDDASKFVKTDLDTMLRDVEAMRLMFPEYKRRDKTNTLTQKMFVGSTLYIYGGTAAKNYRDISIETGRLDEYDAFDRNIDSEGNAFKLAAGRVDAAAFPKMIVGTTPKLKGFSNIDERTCVADVRLVYAVPCPHCGERHPLTFGDRESPHGFKWQNRDPETVRHLCRGCGALFTQREYAGVESQGRWQTESGDVWMSNDAVFFSASGKIDTPRHVACHIWAAYSPSRTWPSIVKEFIEASDKAKGGKREELQTFINTTLGESYAEELDVIDENSLRGRAEPYALGTVPRGCLLLLAGCDTQDNRIEITVWGFGRGSEMWVIHHHIVWGNPSRDETWCEVADYLINTQFRNTFGVSLRIERAAVDTGGHYATDVYEFCAKHARKNIHAVRGYSGAEKNIKQGGSQIEYDWRGRRRKNGLLLSQVGTNLAKDRIHARLQIAAPGPGYVHFSDELSDEWFAQFCGEARAVRRTVRGEESRWTPTRTRVEAFDCAVYAIWAEAYGDGRMPYYLKPESWWRERELRLEPATRDMFDAPPAESPATVDVAPLPAPAAAGVTLAEIIAQFKAQRRPAAGPGRPQV